MTLTTIIGDVLIVVLATAEGIICCVAIQMVELCALLLAILVTTTSPSVYLLLASDLVSAVELTE